MINPHNIKAMIYRFHTTARLYNRFRTWRNSRNHALSDEKFALRKYRESTGKELNLDKPVTFDEKIWYLKLYDHNPLLTRCTDKFLVREYVKECGLEHILNELYGVFDSAWDVDFAELPSCFLKCNHTSGTNLIYEKGKTFDERYFRYEFDFWMHWDYYWNGREWNYKNISRKIIAERILRDREGRLPLDYKFFCFGGEVKFLSLDIGVAQTNGEHSAQYFRNIYNTEFELLPVRETRENSPQTIKKPENFDRMVEYAARLSKPFPHARVDLYNVDGIIYFGEITFHHGGGCNDFQPEAFAKQMGDWINLTGISRKG